MRSSLRIDDPFRDPWLKLDRAEEHVAEFQTRFKEWRDSRVYDIVNEVEANGAEEIVKLRRVNLFPATLNCIVADIVHNVYSALDQMTFILCKTFAGCTDEKWLKKCYFPAASTENVFRGRLRDGKHHKLFNDDIVDLFMRLEPYRGGKHESLYFLHELEVIDKHRSVIDLHSADMVRITGPKARQWIEFTPGGPDDVELGRREIGSDIEYRVDVLPRVFFAKVRGFGSRPLTDIGAFRIMAEDVVRQASEAFAL